MLTGSMIEGAEMPHKGHENHLCLLQNIGYIKANFEKYKRLVQDAKFVCKDCGRVAARADNLCSPEKL
jgi:hypothetical protein